MAIFMSLPKWGKDLLDSLSIKTNKILYDFSLLYKTKRFHVTVYLFSNRSQKISKCGENIGETFFFFPHFDVICEWATWKLSIF